MISNQIMNIQIIRFVNSISNIRFLQYSTFRISVPWVNDPTVACALTCTLYPWHAIFIARRFIQVNDTDQNDLSHTDNCSAYGKHESMCEDLSDCPPECMLITVGSVLMHADSGSWELSTHVRAHRRTWYACSR